MGATYDDLVGHEGYGVGRPGGGPPSEVVVAVCRCGWTGGAHPRTEDGYEALIDNWDRHHARPLLASTVPAAVAALVAELRRALGASLVERPRAVLAAAEDLADWAAEMAGRARAAIGAPEAARRSGPTSHRRG